MLLWSTSIFGRPKVVYTHTIKKLFMLIFSKYVVEHNIGRPNYVLIEEFDKFEIAEGNLNLF